MNEIFSIKLGTPELIIPVWNTCFGDSPEFISNFFEKLCARSLVMFYDHVPAAIVSFPDIGLFRTSAGAEYSMSYLYSLATLPKYRGLGLASELIKQAEQISRSDGIDMISLVPAEPSLFSFYARFGYHTFTWTEEKTFYLESFSDNIKFEKILYKRYSQLREDYLRAHSHVVFCEKLYEYIADQFSFYSGEGWCAAAEIGSDRALYIKECLGDTSMAASALMNHFAVSECRLRSPALSEHSRPFAMAKVLNKNICLPKDGYFGFCLD